MQVQQHMELGVPWTTQRGNRQKAKKAGKGELLC
jgi:hypothetical protein